MNQAPAAEMAKPGLLTSRGTALAAVAIVSLVALQVFYAATADLRTDEAYYWTLSKESVLSYLDHPPMVAWLVVYTVTKAGVLSALTADFAVAAA